MAVKVSRDEIRHAARHPLPDLESVNQLTDQGHQAQCRALRRHPRTGPVEGGEADLVQRPEEARDHHLRWQVRVAELVVDERHQVAPAVAAEQRVEKRVGKRFQERLEGRLVAGPIQRRLDVLDTALAELVQKPGEHRLVEALLATKVVVHRGDVAPGQAGDLANRGGLEAVASEQLLGDPEDPLASARTDGCVLTNIHFKRQYETIVGLCQPESALPTGSATPGRSTSLSDRSDSGSVSGQRQGSAAGSARLSLEHQRGQARRLSHRRSGVRSATGAACHVAVGCPGGRARDPGGGRPGWGSASRPGASHERPLNASRYPPSTCRSRGLKPPPPQDSHRATPSRSARTSDARGTPDRIQSHRGTV